MITCPCKDCITLAICMATTKHKFFFNQVVLILCKKCSLFRKYWVIEDNHLLTKIIETKKIFRFKNDS